MECKCKLQIHEKVLYNGDVDLLDEDIAVVCNQMIHCTGSTHSRYPSSGETLHPRKYITLSKKAVQLEILLKFHTREKSNKEHMVLL